MEVELCSEDVCFVLFWMSSFNNSFVQLKINNQALDSANAPVSPGEIFKVYGLKG